MASVSSLDKDLRKMRLDKYTPQAAKEVIDWIEEILGARLQDADLIDALRDGLALCSLVNKAVSPGVKAKPSNMPFVQRENISLFVRACQMPPLSLPDHDIFLTDDLYEAKDPAQVLQCIVAFSRRANAVKPSVFPRAVGTKSKTPLVNPQPNGASQNAYPRPPTGLSNRERAGSNASDSPATTWNPLAKGSYSGRISPTKSSESKSPPGNVSSWSKKLDEGKTAPAWNIHQYGYMGGASQGNQGIAFGARRQITSAPPPIPSLAEKERRRREEAEEAERQMAQAKEAEERRRRQLEAAEEKARFEEEQRWEVETKRHEEKERAEAEDRRRWEEEQKRRGKEEMRVRQEEEQRRRLEKEEEEAAAAAENTRLWREGETEAQQIRRREGQHETSDNRLRGQLLSQYQAEQNPQQSAESSRLTSENNRIQELEKQLELARERELQYQLEREERSKNQDSRSPELNRPSQVSETSNDDNRQAAEQGHPRETWQKRNARDSRQQPAPPRAPNTAHAEPVPPKQLEAEHNDSNSNPRPRPLPNPSSHASNMNRVERHLVDNPEPASTRPQSHRPADYSTATEVDLENQRRKESQAKTRAGGWASKSLLEREMERERERQQEWAEAQKQTVRAPRNQQDGPGPGQSWDVHQYGYLGGDSQNRGGPGLGVGGARRQIIGPRPPP